MSRIKVLSNILWNSGLRKEAFQVGNLQGATDLMTGMIISESHRFLDLILKDYLLSGLITLEKIFSNDSKTSFAAKKEKAVMPETIILGPKNTDEVVQMLNENNFIEKRWHLWYEDFVKLMEETLGIMRNEEAYRIFSGVLAATSVQTQPQNNLSIAIEYLYRWVQSDSMEKWTEYLSITSGEAFKEEVEKGKRPKKKSDEDKAQTREMKLQRLRDLGLLSGGTRDFSGHGIYTVDRNLARVFKGKRTEGPKVSEFDKALTGDPDAIAVDRHVSRLLLGKPSPSTPKDFDNAKAQIREISERMGIPPAQIQSAVWCMNLFLTEEKAEDYIEIIRARKEEVSALLRKSESLYVKFKGQE
jgi:hypothetical protein